MPLPRSFGRDTITFIAPAPTDAHGDPAGQEQRTVVTGCAVQPAGSSETLDGRDTVTTRARVIAPADAPVTATSRAEWNGHRWDVEGSPEAWNDLAGNPHHLELTLTRTTG